MKFILNVKMYHFIGKIVRKDMQCYINQKEDRMAILELQSYLKVKTFRNKEVSIQ